MDEPTSSTPEAELEQDEARWDAAARVIDDAEYAETYYSEWIRLIDEEVRFVLDSEQHEVSRGHNQNPDDIQALDMSLLSTARRKWSQIGAAPIHMNTWAKDMLADPLAAERAKWAIESELYSAKNLLRRKRKRAIVGCVVGRLWYLGMEWDADLQEIVYDTYSPENVLSCPGFIDPHDPLNPWMILKKRVPVAQARRLAAALGGWTPEQCAEIKADSQGTNETASQSSSPSGLTVLSGGGGEGGPQVNVRDTVDMLIGMYREDPEREEIEETLGDAEPLPEDQWFMRCWQCGYETKDHPPDALTGKLPATGEACPQCQAQAEAEGPQASDVDMPMLERVDSVEEVERYPRYPNGRWFVVLRESRQVIYDKDWPYEKPDGTTLRTFPVVQYRIYDDPRHEVPHSDVSWQWNAQALATYMLQWGVDQMRSSGRIILMPRGALVDSRGRAFTPTNRIDQIAWMKDAMLSKAVQEFQPRGLPSGWMELYQSLQNSFRSNLGTGELGLGPEQSKDIPVGTVRAITESGDIPVDDAIAMVRESDEILLGLIGDMIQCCWNIRRWVRYLGPDGAVAYEYLSGADLTGVDVEIIGTLHLDQQRAAELEKWGMFFGMTPPQQRLVARRLGLNPSEVYQYQMDQMQFMATAGRMPGPSTGGPAGPSAKAPAGSGLDVPPDARAGLEAAAASMG